MRPDPLYARYPFFRAAREAVQRADISPPRLVTEGDPAVERARERVERALMSGTVESETPGRWSDRDELLSYPIARILVSLVGVRAAVEKYAESEAQTASERLTTDLETDDEALRSVSTPRADLATVLDEFDLDGAVRRVDGDRHRADFRIDVTAYLRLADPDRGDGWRLVNRALADGDVPVDGDELTHLLREAVRRRVGDGLPFDVRGSSGGDAIADALADDVAVLRDRLAERERLPDVDAVVPAQFPPCMRALLDGEGDASDPLPSHAAFAATAFLVSLGLDADAIADRWPVLDDGSLSYRATVLADGGSSQYPAPSCATMQAFGDCVNPDERCETIDHPLRYYASAIADTDADAD
jgi:DNA primase large subunit